MKVEDMNIVFKENMQISLSNAQITKSKNYHSYSHMTFSNNSLPLHIRDRKIVTMLQWREALKKEKPRG